MLWGRPRTVLRKGGELLRRNQSDGMLGGRNPRGDQGHHAGGQSTFCGMDYGALKGAQPEVMRAN